MEIVVYEGTGEGDVGKIPRLKVNGKLVLTTAQIAKFYECPAQNIRKTFHLHREKFIEGEHYFKLTGEALKEFKSYITESNLVTNGNLPFINLTAPHFILWTALGAASFAKSLTTRRAWAVYEQLALNYFNGKKIVGEKSVEKTSKTALTPKEKVDRLIQLAKITKDATRRENLIAVVEKIIIG